MTFLDIFLEAIIDVSIAPFGNQNTFYAIIRFQTDQALAALMAATLGAGVAIAINWKIGEVIGEYLLEKNPPAKFHEFRVGFKEYGWPLLLLIWVPLGSFLPLIAAALGFRLKPTLVMAVPAMLGFYVYQYFSVV